MKALSLTRPWTTLVLHHGKDVENRTWTTSYRGPLLIHGARSWDARAVLDHARTWPVPAPVVADLSTIIDTGTHLTGLLGSVTLTGICTAGLRDETCACGPWAMRGQAHWQLANPRPFPLPIPHQGRLGLWTVDDALLLAAATGNLAP